MSVCPWFTAVQVRHITTCDDVWWDSLPTVLVPSITSNLPNCHFPAPSPYYSPLPSVYTGECLSIMSFHPWFTAAQEKPIIKCGNALWDLLPTILVPLNCVHSLLQTAQKNSTTLMGTHCFPSWYNHHLPLLLWLMIVTFYCDIDYVPWPRNCCQNHCHNTEWNRCHATKFSYTFVNTINYGHITDNRHTGATVQTCLSTSTITAPWATRALIYHQIQCPMLRSEFPRLRLLSMFKFFSVPGKRASCSSLLSQPAITMPCLRYYSVHCFGSSTGGKVLPLCGEHDGGCHHTVICPRLSNSYRGSSCWTCFPHILQEAPVSSP